MQTRNHCEKESEGDDDDENANDVYNDNKMTMTTVLTLGGSRQGTSSQYQYCYLDLVI